MLCGTAALLGCIYTLLAGVLVRRFFAREPVEPANCPSVTVVRPLHGDEWSLQRNLESFFQQDYAGPVQFLFGVHDSSDPALRVVETIRQLYPDAHIDVVADARLYGPNRKISNILNMLPQARHDVFVFADSDVSVGPSWLRHAVGALEQPDVGLVTCAYRGEPAPGCWSLLSSVSVNYQFIPGVVAGVSLKLAHPCLGPTIAMRRSTLDRIGGFEPFVHHLAEDYEIGRAVRNAGEKIVIPPFVISHACVERDAACLVGHKLRWGRTIRAIDPLGHLGSALMHPVALSVLAVLLSGAAAWSWPAVPLAVLAQLALKRQADRALSTRRSAWWLPALWDIASFGVFVASFCSRRVSWRGFSFNVDSEGRLSPIEDR
ncbi:glucosyltransferase [Burkholderia sp. WAC0059]|nr:bacteriohopanetetrol glucosamine biosynthesis glycosyltransferase HpnI [Burkholderia sp. WAC0059]PLZ00746.1 glucosyltransferase [Burkholderia sp. WAC0059]